LKGTSAAADAAAASSKGGGGSASCGGVEGVRDQMDLTDLKSGLLAAIAFF
jgi:hypothetical protein